MFLVLSLLSTITQVITPSCHFILTGNTSSVYFAICQPLVSKHSSCVCLAMRSVLYLHHLHILAFPRFCLHYPPSYSNCNGHPGGKDILPRCFKLNQNMTAQSGLSTHRTMTYLLPRCLFLAVCISYGQGTKWQCHKQMTVPRIFQAYTKEVTDHMCMSLTVHSETEPQ